jgi:hypothetical protein
MRNNVDRPLVIPERGSGARQAVSGLLGSSLFIQYLHESRPAAFKERMYTLFFLGRMHEFLCNRVADL